MSYTLRLNLWSNYQADSVPTQIHPICVIEVTYSPTHRLQVQLVLSYTGDVAPRVLSALRSTVCCGARMGDSPRWHTVLLGSDLCCTYRGSCFIEYSLELY
jgi:hypothetical protein